MTVIYSGDQGLINHRLRQMLGDALGGYRVRSYKSPNQLFDLLHANSMFETESEKRYVINNCDFLSSESEAKIAGDLISALKQNADLKVFLTVESDRLLFKNELIGGFLREVEVIEVPRLTVATFKALINDFFARHKVSLSFEQLNLLLSRIPQNALILESELKKLLLFSPEEITTQLLDDLITEYDNASIFKLIEYVAAGQREAAVGLFDSLVNRPHGAIEIAQFMAAQVLRLVMVKWALGKNYRDQEICRDMGLSPFQLGQTKKILNLLSLKDLEFFLNGILSIDIKMKRLNLDSNVLRLFVSKGIN